MRARAHGKSLKERGRPRALILRAGEDWPGRDELHEEKSVYKEYTEEWRDIGEEDERWY